MREYGLPLTHIYLYIDRIYDSVLTRKNKSQQKPRSRTTPWSTNVSEISHTVKRLVFEYILHGCQIKSKPLCYIEHTAFLGTNVGMVDTCMYIGNLLFR